MIGRVVRGWRAHGLINYLFGPGRHHEHSDPHLIATWDGCPELHQPLPLPTPEGEPVWFDVGRLAAALTDPAVAAGIPQREPTPVAGAERQQGPVWHCSLRTAPGDRVLTDQEWAGIVADVLDRTGIAKRGDPGGCRWVAVRHAVDHVHVAAVLVRQDTLRRVSPYRDFLRVREVCLDAEREFGLRATTPADRTAPRRASRAETEKAARRGWPEAAARDRLRQVVRAAAAAAANEQAFLQLLAADDTIVVRTRRDVDGRLVGYAVADPRDTETADASPRERDRLVWFGGRALAADLSAVRLAERWAGAPDPDPAPVDRVLERREALDSAAAAAEDARRELPVGGAGAAHAVGDVLLVLATAVEDAAGGPLTVAAAEFEPAARHPGRGQPSAWSQASADLRHAAWRVARAGRFRPTNPSSGPALLALLLALASLVAELAAWRDQRGQLVAAAAARRAQESLQTAAAPLRARWPATTVPKVAAGPARTGPSATTSTSRLDRVRRAGSSVGGQPARPHGPVRS
ncbi:relaxase/mobilization nuclease domain-containing protein [Kutzneria buriramensis]|uniref:MobA/VirD2-like nuclease domain-containing protein n=1 Tax=Kutzneria buriramensis TaxID=1045776 RepID=A0A3E0G6G4_9PSEU|nr:hypothetical protein [Kutzneria buriramensis]REH18313.1 hypothetical protein BCF44_13668 [Kutzneria buriramensis]